MEILTEYVLIGEDEDEAQDLLSSEPGRAFLVHQGLYMESESEWGKGDRVGSLHGSVIVGRRGKVICHLIFEFDGDETIVAGGVLPPGESTFGDGALAVTGGTGRFAKAAGICVVQTMNPKRYSIFL